MVTVVEPARFTRSTAKAGEREDTKNRVTELIKDFFFSKWTKPVHI